MNTFTSQDLLEQLAADTRALILAANQLQQLDPGILLLQPAPNQWNVAQVLEHMNSYGRYYLPLVEKSLESNKQATNHFKAGWLGNYFTKLMLPGVDGKVGNKLKAPKGYRPAASTDLKPSLDTFITQHQQLLLLLARAKKINIGAIRIPISIAPFIKLKLGDVFRFFIAHEQRHFVQIANLVRR